MKPAFGMFAIILAITSCSTVIKTSSEMGQFEIEVDSHFDAESMLVQIKGVNINSGQWIERYEIVYQEDVVVVNIHQTVRKTGFSGPYSIEFTIPTQVEEIRIGNDTVWRKL